MKITILNKNRINNTGSYNISNLNSYEIDEGFTYTKCFNKTLDSANIRLSHLTSKIDIEPLDEVLLNDDSRFGNIYMCVENYVCIEESLDPNNITYTYEIALLSQIKRLEGVLLPNLSITPLKENKRSVGFYLRQYLNEYGEKIRYDRPMELTPNENEQVLDNAYNFSQRLLDRYDNVICPELQWNEPTLREVIDDLLMVDNCIATLNNGVIDYLDLEETTGNEITNYNYVRESQAIEDYVSEIKMTMQNGLQNENGGITKTVEYIHFTAPDGETLTDDNAILQTSHPILEIENLFVQIPVRDSVNRVKYYQVNLKGALNLIVEANEYKTRKIKYANYDADDIANYTEYQQYQNYSFYYNRGDNKILGFGNLTRTSLIIGIQINTLYLIIDIIYKYLETINIYIDPQDRISWQVLSFCIEYETTDNITFSAGKTDIQTNYRQIKDNQTNSWVNANTQAKLEYSKADRLGNKSILINQRCANSNMITIGDKKDDFIVYQVSYQIYKDAINVNAQAVKHYILKDFFTGVNSKIRTWVNAKQEAFEKIILTKYFVELGTKKRIEYSTLPNERLTINDLPVNYLMPPLYYGITSSNFTPMIPLKYLAIETYSVHTKENPDIVDTKLGPEVLNKDSEWVAKDLIIKELNYKIMGKSVVVVAGLDDNAYENYSLYDDISGLTFQNVDQPQVVLTENVGGQRQRPIKMTDSNYEFNKVVLRYLNGTDIQVSDEFVSVSDFIANISYYNAYHQSIFQLPIFDANKIQSSGKYTNYWERYKLELINRKDNREIPKYALQFEYCTENRDMYLTETLINDIAITPENYMNLQKYIYLGAYEYGKKEVDSTLTKDDNATITYDEVNRKFTINLSVDRQNRAIYIAKINGSIYVGLKNTNQFYINILKNRNKTIYNSNRVKIGEL